MSALRCITEPPCTLLRLADPAAAVVGGGAPHGCALAEPLAEPSSPAAEAALEAVSVAADDADLPPALTFSDLSRETAPED